MTFAILFSDVGAGEWFVLLAVILVVMGPKRLPETARKFGNYYSKFRRAAESFKRQLLEMDTELTNAVSEVEKEANAAFTVEDPDGGPASEGGGYDGGYPYDDYGRDYYSGGPEDESASAVESPAAEVASAAPVSGEEAAASGGESSSDSPATEGA